ncbi:hypothetical protein Ddye_016711 [Dipteronia dyeriana]|uniref:Reduced epidermal fluorescence 4 n=1 Tax=Dipteronia dyeriana TaxID=168575 RepID=A0AAD9U7D8_9ROSI|nr:hypothetical protein Ddye_016711 [Dipteronia dyeriana]
MKSIDDILHLSRTFGLKVCEPGLLLLEFVFSVVWQLLDASLDDERLLELAQENNFRWSARPVDVEIDSLNSFNEKRTEHHEGLCKANTIMAIEIIGEFLRNKETSRILYLACKNMPLHWGAFIQRLRLLVVKSTALKNSKNITPEVLLQLTSDRRKLLTRKSKTVSLVEFHAVMASGSLISSADQCNGTSRSALWLPIDLFLEDAMDGTQVGANSAVETLTGLVKALQAVNVTTWHDTFLGLWIAALRLVQRERDPSEGPVPRLDTCMCMLLCISTLAIADIIEEDESEFIDETESSSCNPRKDKLAPAPGNVRKGLITSLKLLGEYEGLLAAPLSVQSIANQAAAKAILLVSGLTVGNGYYDCVSMNDLSMNCSGNMRHLIVEACIARNLLDTSAYLWPGYVNARSNQVLHSVTSQMSCWSSLMKGSPLTPSLVNALVAFPASSLAEIEKIYEITLNGSDDEKISAATILCGASLVRGWSIQENTLLFVVRLLSPSVPADYSGSESHLIGYAPFLNVLLLGLSSVDCVQILSLHGLVPLLAGALLPICEVFGSSIPNVSWALPTGENFSCHSVFSNAFTLLLRLWRFDKPPLENATGDVMPVGSQQSPEYLLLVRNCQLASFGKAPKDKMKTKRFSKNLNISVDPIFMDSFPQLKRWYRQHQECIVSTLCGLVQGTTVHRVVDALLNMMFRKINRSGTTLTPATSGTCAHGKLSPRELATGLKELADFLPASLATIVSYFAAEVTRGIWMVASMNGTDWPSPAANLSTVEQQVKKIIAATGVDVPSLTIGGNSPATLPLPLAALVSLTITYKLDKASERFLTLVGPALSSLATSCPWPCMPIIASLWSQKVRRWSDFLVFQSSRTVFHHNSDAVVQLLKSCFTSTLGLSSSNIYSNSDVGALLGHGFGSHFSGGISPVAPGIVYLRVHRSVRDVLFMTEEIVSLLMSSVKDIASSGLSTEKLEKLKKTKYGMRYGQVSLAAAMTRVKVAASLGASLVWISGGLNLVQSLMTETLPSWFISVHGSEQDGESGGMVSMLGGYALAYFAVFCGAFAWGVYTESRSPQRRPKVLGAHLEFLASALDGKISLGCDGATWRAYVSGFVSLLVACMPKWMMEIDVDVLKRMSKGLRQWNEEALAIALLGSGGVGTMGAAVELIVEARI